MKKKLTTHKKSKNTLDMKKIANMDSKSTIASSKSFINDTSENNPEQQSNKYPSDIQRLFEHLGID